MKWFLPLLLTAILLPACSVKLDLDADILEGEDTAVSWMERLPLHPGSARCSLLQHHGLDSMDKDTGEERRPALELRRTSL